MSVLSKLQFYLMHFMPYPDVVPGRPQGQWVDIPNTHFDAVKGHKLYKEYIDELVLGDKLGYDGLVVNEDEQAYRNVAEDSGDGRMLREGYVHRAGHCTFTPAETIAAFQALIHRVNSGVWGDSTTAGDLQAAATALGPTYNVAPAAYIAFTPTRFLRPYDLGER